MVIDNIARSLGMSETTFLLLIVAAALFAFFLQTKIHDKKKRKNYLISAGVVLAIIILFSAITSAGGVGVIDLTPVDSGWKDRYVEAATSDINIYAESIRNTNYYLYEDPIITSIANDIAGSSRSSKEAMEKAMAFVYQKIEYDPYEPDSACFRGTAPAILESGIGQCDTQSIVLISILRRMGIAAKPVGGCVVVNHKDCALQSIFLQSLQNLGFAPKFTPMSTIPVVRPDEVYARGQQPPTGRSGGLHAWVTAWEPEEGWLTLEATTGKFANTKCYYYHVELFPADNDKESICVSKNFNYARACQLNDMEGLNAHGLGLSTEVTP